MDHSVIEETRWWSGLLDSVKACTVSSRPDRAAERIARCVLGLALFGVGIALIIRAELARPRGTSSTPASAS